MAATLSAANELIRFGDRLLDHLEHNPLRAALLGDLAQRLAGAGRDPCATRARGCPACLHDDSEPAFSAPVYDFHHCRNCSMLYTPRVLADHVVHSRYTATRLAETYWAQQRNEAYAGPPDGECYAALLDPLLALVPSRSAAIDVGSRFGRLVAALQVRFDEALGLELDPRTAATGARRFGVRLRERRLEELNQPAGSIDLITMNDVLDHLVQLEPLLRAARRLLRPKGVLYIRVPNGASVGIRLLRDKHPMVTTHQHINLFTPHALQRLVQRHGFRVHEVHTDDSIDLHTVGAHPHTSMQLANRLASAASKYWHIPSRFGRGGHLELVALKGN